MSFARSLTVAMLVASVGSLLAPSGAHAQRRGAIELGVLGRFAKQADTLRLDPAGGGGGRIGVYVSKRWLLETEVSFTSFDVNLPLSYTSGRDSLRSVSDLLFAYRAVYNHPLSEHTALLLGAGYAYDSYGRVRVVAPRGGGPHGLVGLRLGLGDRVSARLEGTGTYILPEKADAKPVARAMGLNLGAQAGISVLFRQAEPKTVVQVDTVKITRLQRDTIYINRIDTVRLAATPSPRPVVIGAVNFAFNKSDLTPEAKLVLAQIAESLVDPQNASRTIVVTGNTDGVGSERYNLQLGQARADAAKAFLVERGVAETRITARTRGASDPLAPNTTVDGRATNRRALVLLSN